MAPKSLHFVLEELMAWAPGPVLARHRYGCRVLERRLQKMHESVKKSQLAGSEAWSWWLFYDSIYFSYRIGSKG